MSKELRLDKLLGHMGCGSRKELKLSAKRGEITVNGKTVSSASMKVDADVDKICFRGQRIRYREHIYLMLNKPKGVISATEDEIYPTVVDLLTPEYQAFKPHPVGRLDLDTTGLLLLTSDGVLTHNLLSPKKGVPKTYYAEVDGEVGEAEIAQFAVGVYLETEDYTTLPAELVILEKGSRSEVQVTISEGKYHQVKRMFEKTGKRVIELKRISMGDLLLDPDLAEGEFRELTEQELLSLTRLR